MKKKKKAEVGSIIGAQFSIYENGKKITGVIVKKIDGKFEVKWSDGTVTLESLNPTKFV